MESASELRPINVIPLAGATCGTAIWRMAERLHVTVIVKATFELVPDTAMQLAAPEEIVTAEVHHHKSPTRSVRLTQDTAPYLPYADVLLTGHACAPEGSRVEALSVRLAVFRGALLLDKTVHVSGDRDGDMIVPFERMPLTYERAYGGIGWEDNPLGVGHGAATAGKLPNLLDPAHPERTACFAPIARSWPARKRLLGAVDRRALERPGAEIPPGFDWSYFQSAPADQRIDHLKGDEWIILDGVHPAHPHLRSYLPCARGAARVYGMADGGHGHPLGLVADTLRIDADALRCSVVWRGSFPIPHAAALAAIRIVGGVETEHRRIEWPHPSAAPRPSSPELFASPAGAPLDTLPGSLALDDEIETVQRPLDDFLRDRRPQSTEPRKPSPGPTAPPPGRPGDALETLTGVDETLRRPRPAPKGAKLRDLPPPAPPSTEDAPAPRPLPGIPAARESAAGLQGKPAPLVSVQGIELHNETSLAFGVVPWGMKPARDCLTVIAKATCALRPSGPAELRAEAEALSGDRFEDGVCVYPSDLALFKVRADVTLDGRAYAPSGTARQGEVSFRFGAADNSFTRRVLVFGERRWEPGRAALRPSAPEPWAKMPLRPDRAFGGSGFHPNPAGMGCAEPLHPARAGALLPHLEDPDARIRTPLQTPAPVFLSPIPLVWKDRWASLGRGRAPWSCLPEELDWTHYQAAPRPQQLAFLRGDEPFVITHAHPEHPVIEGELPGIRARCFVLWSEGRGGGFEEINLHLDTVAFEVDRGTLSLVFRGVVGVPDERVPEIDALFLITEPTANEGMSLTEARAKLLRR